MNAKTPLFQVIAALLFFGLIPARAQALSMDVCSYLKDVDPEKLSGSQNPYQENLKDKQCGENSIETWESDNRAVKYRFNRDDPKEAHDQLLLANINRRGGSVKSLAVKVEEEKNSFGNGGPLVLMLIARFNAEMVAENLPRFDAHRTFAAWGMRDAQKAYDSSAQLVRDMRRDPEKAIEKEEMRLLEAREVKKREDEAAKDKADKARHGVSSFRGSGFEQRSGDASALAPDASLAAGSAGNGNSAASGNPTDLYKLQPTVPRKAAEPPPLTKTDVGYTRFVDMPPGEVAQARAKMEDDALSESKTIEMLKSLGIKRPRFSEQKNEACFTLSSRMWKHLLLNPQDARVYQGSYLSLSQCDTARLKAVESYLFNRGVP